MNTRANCSRDPVILTAIGGAGSVTGTTGTGEWLAEARRDNEDMMGGGVMVLTAGDAESTGGVDAVRVLVGESVTVGGESITREVRP